jgi:TonB family protein
MIRLLLLSATLLVAPIATHASSAQGSESPQVVVHTAPVGDSSASLTRPAGLTRALPAAIYPHRAVEFRIEGTVRLAYTIDERGRVRDVEVLQSLFPDCNDEAVRVIRSARFEPALDADGRPVAVRYMTDFVFTLGG